MSRNTGKNISKNLRSKYSQKCLDHAKQYATDARKTASKRAIWNWKLLIKLQESQKLHHKIIQKQM